MGAGSMATDESDAGMAGKDSQNGMCMDACLHEGISSRQEVSTVALLSLMIS